MKSCLFTLTLLLWITASQAAEPLRIAAASDLRYALEDIVRVYREEHPDVAIDVIYGSSGKMTTQIINGAPYDLFFSADIAYPERLAERSLTATRPTAYATGRIVIWSSTIDASALTLADLASPEITRIAIAQPAHAPYGKRAREAMQSAGIWDGVQHKLVFGENIAHTAGMVQSGAAQVGLIALSLARFPELARHGYHLIDSDLHKPLTQAFVVTRRGHGKSQAHDFAEFMATERVHRIMARYGFVMPE